MKHNLVLTLAFCIVLTLPVLAQNVGIGLDTPSHKLTILSPDSNTVRLLGPGVLGSQARLSFGNAGGAFFEEDVDDHLTIYSKWRTGLLGGWVGVGTKSPEGPLHTFWKYGGFTTIVENTDTTGDFSGVFGLFRNNAGTGFSLGLNSSTHFDPEATFLDVPFHLKILTGGSERMRITQYGNVGIGTDTPDSSAMLHVQSTDKGMLIPRMTTAERNAITTPATGLLVYDTDTGSFWYYEYNVWNEIAIPRLQIDSGTDTTTISIPDSDLTGITDTITLSDPDTISADLQFKVCLDITHSWTSDLDISLESPDGTVIDLSSNNGGSGDNYTGTCFTTGSANPITGGSAPFIGDWQPEEPFSNFIGDNIAGGWKLKVVDEAGGDIGQLNNWAISISRAFGPTMLADGDGDTRVTVEDQPDEDMIRMLTGGASRMVITSSGNVGIGTSDPDTKLHIEDAFPALQLLDKDHPSTFDDAGGIISAYGNNGVSGSSTGRLWYLGSNSINSFDAIFGNQTPTGKLLLATNGVPQMIIDASGKVGIGTSSPSWNLDIVGESLDEGSVFQMSNSNKSHFIRMFSGRLNDPKPYLHWKAGSPFLFQSSNDDNSQYNEWMRISATGNVGIGTTTPANKLDVEGGLAIGTAYSGTTSAPTNGAIIQGSVGIGTSGPMNGKLHVEGNETPIILSGFAYTSTNPIGVAAPSFLALTGFFSGAVAADQFIAQSDQRMKKILGISNAEKDLATLMAIEITDYNFIDTICKGTAQYKKVVAQQVAEVYPLAVQTQVRDVIPDIYQRAAVQNGWIMLETDLAEGDLVQLIAESKATVYEVLEAESDRFKVANFDFEGPGLFVYGREVHDFHTVDYEAIAMLNVSATQEQQRLIEELQNENARLQVALQNLQAKISDMEDLKQRLAKLEASLSNDIIAQHSEE